MGNQLSPPKEVVVHCEVSALEELVRFMYTGDLRVQNETVAELMQAAETLKMDDAMNLCADWFKSNISQANALAASNFAVRFSRPELQQTVEQFVLRNMQNLVHSHEFVQLELPRVKELLSSDDANLASEVDVFQAVVKWVTHEPAMRMIHFAELLHCVRLPLMSSEELLDHVEAHELVQADEVAKAHVYEVFKYQALPESRRAALQMSGTRPRNHQGRW